MNASIPFRRLLTVLLALTLVACTPAPDGVLSRISADYVEAQHSYRFAAGAASLAAGERDRIAAFLAGAAPRRTDTLFVTVPAGGSARLDAQRLDHLHALLARQPAQVRFLRDESFGRRAAPGQTGILRLVRTTAARAECAATATPAPGCATAHNLTAMVAHPADLLAPVSTGRRHLGPSR